MSDTHDVLQIQMLDQEAYVPGKQLPIDDITRAGAAAVKVNIDCVDVPSRKPLHDFVPATAVKTRGVQQKYRGAVARPFIDT